MSAALDYHVGILRGYMLALNAPTQVLHAVEILLSDHRSKAGELIGAPAQDMVSTLSAVIKPEPPAPQVIPAKATAPVITDQSHKRHPWTTSDLANLRAMYERGASVADIANKLNRTAAAIFTQLSVQGIKRK